MRGDGSFYERSGKIYVCGAVDDKFYKKSTNMKASKENFKILERRGAINFLRDLVAKSEKRVIQKSLEIESFGKMALSISSDNRSKPVQKDYELILDRYILPYFKHMQLDQIMPLDVEKWQRTIKHLSFDRQTRIKRVLRMIFDKARKNRMIQFNPVSDSDALVNNDSKKEEPYYTEEEISLILNEVKKDNDWIYLWFLIAFTTGLRVGEMLGLRWSDFDLERGILYLRRTRCKGVEGGSNSRKNHERDIVLLQETLETLRRFKMNATVDYVFVSSTGKPWSESKNIVDYIIPFLDSIGVEYKSLKATRKSFSTAMNRANVDFFFVQETLGHSLGSAITLKNYMGKNLTIEEKLGKSGKMDDVMNGIVGSTMK